MPDIVPINQEPVVESTATPEVQEAAEKMGWQPAERFKGDPERFVDADQYIERGETVLPIVKAQNLKLHTQLDTLAAEAFETKKALAVAQTKIAEIEELHVVDKAKAIEIAKVETKAALAAASEAGDHTLVADLTNDLVELNIPEPAPMVQPPVEAPPKNWEPDADLKAFAAANPWWDGSSSLDKRKTAVALAVATELRDAGETADGASFYAKVLEGVNETFPVAAPRIDKVESGPNGVGSDLRTHAAGNTSYAGLPAEAKAACMVDAPQFVGSDKRYKTEADWQARYAAIYNQGE